MKKSVLFMVMAATALLLMGCSFGKKYEIDYECSQDYKGAKLHILNWGEYVDQGLIKEFQERCNVKVIYEDVDSNESMLTKLVNGDTDYDILVPSDYMIERLQKEGLLETIDFGNIPNFQYIEEELKGWKHDPEDKYSVPYFWGTVGLMYNKNVLAELNIEESELNSWQILKDKRLKENIYLYDSARDMFMVGFKLVDGDLSVNVVDNDEDAYAENIEKAIKELRKVQELALKYGTDDVKLSIVNGDAAVGLVYSGDYLEMYYELGDDADDIGYVIPEEGSNLWFDSFVIPKKSKNKRLAEEFINFMCDPKVAYYNAIYVGYATANKGAYDLLKNDEDYTDVIELEAYRPKSMLEKLEVYRDLGAYLNNKLNQEFDQLRG